MYNIRIIKKGGIIISNTMHFKLALAFGRINQILRRAAA